MKDIAGLSQVTPNSFSDESHRLCFRRLHNMRTGGTGGGRDTPTSYLAAQSRERLPGDLEKRAGQCWHRDRIAGQNLPEDLGPIPCHHP